MQASLQENINFETTICNHNSSYKILISHQFANVMCHKLVANMQPKCAVAIWLFIWEQYKTLLRPYKEVAKHINLQLIYDYVSSHKHLF